MYKMDWSILLSQKRINEARDDYKSINDSRDSFDIDMDTIVGLSSFRRLQDKAQVFPLEKGDFARSRLTHSLEVMAAAESIGKNSINTIKEKYQQIIENNNTSQDTRRNLEAQLEVIDVIPTVLKCAALIHDMGNPPFGHIGESIISSWCSVDIKKYCFLNEKSKNKIIINGGQMYESMHGTLDYQQKKDIKSFDGNAQLLRIINNLGPSGNGINLSYAVVSTCIKYVNPSTAKSIGQSGAPAHLKKVGYFQSEQDLVERVNNEVGTHFNGRYNRNPLAYLLEASDDISYLTSDLEDSVKKGIIEFSEVYEDIKKEVVSILKKNSIETEFTLNKGKTEISFNQNFHLDEKTIRAMDSFQDLLTYFVDIAENSKSNKDVKISKIRKYLRGKLISQCSLAFDDEFESIMNGNFDSELLKVIDLAAITKYIRKKLIDNVYNCRTISQTKVKVHKIMSTLLEYFVPAAFTIDIKNKPRKSEDKDDLMRELMSSNYMNSCEESIRRDPNNSTYYKLMLALDHISGMTDLYAVEVYEIISAVRTSLIS